jgi:phospholipase C
MKSRFASDRKNPASSVRVLIACAIGPLICSCAGSGGASSTVVPAQMSARSASSSSYISHVIVMIQENRSFDDLFATFPGADGTTKGKIKGRRPIKLKEVSLLGHCDFGHSYKGFIRDYDGGKMDGFTSSGTGDCTGSKTAEYQYVNPSQIAPYWDIADEYVLADHMFQTQGSGSYTAHQDLIRGATTIDSSQTESLVDFPTQHPWGCDSPAGTLTSLLVWASSKLSYEGNKGPFPCSNKFPGSGSSYATLRDLLDAKSVSWKYYSPPVKNGVGGYWNAFDTIAPVRYGSEWGTNVTTAEPFQNEIFDDISSGTLPAVSWLIPDESGSDHPGAGNTKDVGPDWVASVVNAVGESSYWNSTAIIVVWDDWGGFYDHVPPPFFDNWGGLGFRVPMLLVSAYARQGTGSQGGYISHTQYEFGSILKFIEDNWDLGSLGTTDSRATSVVDCFDFTQSPRKFTSIPSDLSASYFRAQPASYLPIDSE